MEQILESSKWIICRICLKNSTNKMVKIFSMDAEVEDVAYKIRECGGVLLEKGDNYPDNICSKCLTLLKIAYKFRTLCQRSQQQLAELLQPPTSSNSPNITFDNETEATSQETKETLTVKRECETIPEDYSNDAMHFMVESDASEETTEHIVVDQGTIVGFIEIPDTSHNDNTIEYLHEDGEDSSNAADQSNNIKLDTNSFQSNGELTVVFDQSEETSNFEETEEAIKSKEQVESNETQLYVIEKRIMKKTRKSKAKLRQASESACDQDNSPTFICFQCGNIYAERSKLTLHLKMHNKEKPHECEICHKRFAQTPQLSRHMNSHTGSRPFKCKFCPASFADPSTCIKHERIHTNERPYKCQTCGKAFSYSNVLKVHMMTHTGEKPFSCKFCGKKFAQLHHTKAHEKTHNNQSALKIGEEEEDLENDFHM